MTRGKPKTRVSGTRNQGFGFLTIESWFEGKVELWKMIKYGKNLVGTQNIEIWKPILPLIRDDDDGVVYVVVVVANYFGWTYYCGKRGNKYLVYLFSTQIFARISNSSIWLKIHTFLFCVFKIVGIVIAAITTISLRKFDNCSKAWKQNVCWQMTRSIILGKNKWTNCVSLLWHLQGVNIENQKN